VQDTSNKIFHAVIKTNTFKLQKHIPLTHSTLLIKKNQLDALISQIYSWNETLHVSDSSSVHHQEFSTVWHIPLLWVQWKLLMMDRGTVRNM